MQIKQQVKALKRLSLLVYFTARDSRTPLMLRVLALAVAAYAFSPIDLIPDFIPVLGLLDDLLLIALGVAVIIKFTPTEIIEAARHRADLANRRPVSYTAAVFIGVIWLLIILTVANWIFLRAQ